MSIYIDNFENLDGYLSTKYDYVYISIGSKFNQERVNRYIRRTNAQEQMFPLFLQGRFDKNILLIVVDVFPDMDSIVQSTDLIDSAITENITCLVINQFCNHTFLTSFIKKMTDYFQSHQISHLNCMICNYVRHMNTPNPIEQDSEDNIPSIIQNYLNKYNNGKYDTCLYQWFGYRTYFYNYIYNYKNMRRFEFLHTHMNTVEGLLQEMSNFDNNKSTVIQNPSVIHILKNMVDITRPNHFTNAICISILQGLSNNDQITVVP